MWATFFDDVEAPTPNDPAALPKSATPADLSDDEVARQAKTPRARVLKPRVVDGLSSSTGTDNGEDLIWRSKGKNKKVVEVVDGGKGKAQMGVDDKEEDIEESKEDDKNFTLQSPKASNGNELDDDLTRNVERGDLDSDLEFLRPRGMDFNACVEVDMDFDDDANRARAQSRAHRDRALMEQRIRGLSPLRGGWADVYQRRGFSNSHIWKARNSNNKRKKFSNSSSERKDCRSNDKRKACISRFKGEWICCGNSSISHSTTEGRADVLRQQRHQPQHDDCSSSRSSSKRMGSNSSNNNNTKD
ncbi:hypothetical protein CBR_g34573 [Chara braunii]|uniref:Uncharacterized protein n=1 Tax=Chara braunii TaxID=69332 RepID=A0A388LIZ4_CHABU|nr:hypothetical protein CBR_g34573 [Chara braunii]|eukprot:GBG82289.1 hypothetical protein CBR_g34573 [Chara braunii]